MFSKEGDSNAKQIEARFASSQSFSIFYSKEPINSSVFTTPLLKGHLEKPVLDEFEKEQEPEKPKVTVQEPDQNQRKSYESQAMLAVENDTPIVEIGDVDPSFLKSDSKKGSLLNTGANSFVPANSKTT